MTVGLGGDHRQKIAEAVRRELDWREIPERPDMRRYVAEIAAQAALAALQLTQERRKMLKSGVILSADAEGWEGAEDQARWVSSWEAL